MPGFLTEQNLIWRDRARTVAEKVVRPLAAKYDRLQEYPWEIKEAIAKAGLSGVWIPEEYGGSGGGVIDLCICVEELSRACGGVGVLYAVNALGTFPVLVGGTEEQKHRFLRPIAKGEKLISFGLSEKFAGSDAASLRATAVRDGDFYVLNGEKKWNTNGGAADIYTVFAVTDPASKSRRTSAIMVEKGTPGFRIGKIEDKMGIRCVPVVEIHFENCRVPAKNLLGEVPGMGFKHAMMTLDKARPGVAAQAVGLAQGALEESVKYAKQRRAFGKNIAEFQAIQWMLADMETEIEAARALVHNAAWLKDAHPAKMGASASKAKLYASEMVNRVVYKAVQIHGSVGYSRETDVERMYRDARVVSIYEGTSEIQRMIIARDLGL